MQGVPGFLSFVGVTVGDRLLTISAWERPGDTQQLMKGGRHGEAMKAFFGPELAAGGVTGVWTPDHIGVRWVRCGGCNRMVSHDKQGATCSCGAALPEPLAYW